MDELFENSEKNPPKGGMNQMLPLIINSGACK
jgi:hypothetical protein